MQASRITCIALSMIATILTTYAQERPTPTSSLTVSSQAGQGSPNYGNKPLLFEANQGQTDSQVKFLSQGNGYAMFLTSGSMVLSFRPMEATPASPVVASPDFGSKGRSRSAIRQMEVAARAQKSAATVFAINLVGSNANPQVVGEDPLSTKVNYFIGRDPKKWRRNVPTYARVRYRNVYPGIDLVYYGNNRSMEYDFDLAPAADASQIQFAVKGADALNIDSNGNLVLTRGASELRFKTPILYQEINGIRVRVSGTYVLRDSTHVGFEVGSYDTTKPLVIDPVLVYSTYLGGSSDDFSNGIAVGSTGDAYVVGLTDSPDFPLASIGSYNPMQFRMFLTKFDPTGSTLLFADYFGGTTGNDDASSLALDSSGNAYVTGSAMSSDFPVVSPYQSTLSGSQDAFLIKFSADGSSIIYSTYLGGSNSQVGNSISVDPSGEAVIAGITQSTDFPMASPHQSSVSADQFGDWGVYGFLTKFATNGASLLYSTYLAGSTLNTSSCSGCFPDSELLGVATDASGNAYITGFTTTTDFPVTSGSLTTTFPGSNVSDVGFVTKFTNSGGIAYSTYLGGATASFLNAIAVDSSGSAYVTGYDIAGDNFPIVTTSICDPSVAACNGAVIAKLNPAGSSLVYSTFLGTSNNMAGQAIQIDASGDAFIVGSDLQFDLSNPIEAYAGNGDVVVAEIDPSATTLLMATFLGGQGWEAASGLALDTHGAVYVTGVTQSPDFPVTQSAFQMAWGGQTDAFITKIDPTTNAPAVAMGPFSLQFAPQSVGSTSAPQTTILRNMGSAALNISRKTVGPDFAEIDDCGATVAAASFCTFTVTFTPTASGTFSEALTIVDDAQGSPHSVALAGTGTGAPQIVTISPSSLTFPPSSVGATSSAQVITFTNNGSATVVVSGIQVTGNFTAKSTTCGTVIPQGTCTVGVGFIPASSGPLTGTLQFLDSASGSPQGIVLKGSGTDFVTYPVVNQAVVRPGGTAIYKLSVSPTGGPFSNPVTFACDGAPAFANCMVSPGSITPGSNPVAVSVAVTTSGPAAPLHATSGTWGGLLASWQFAQLAVFGVIVLGANNRRKSRPSIAAAVTIMLLLLLGCGGSSTGTGPSTGASGTTPPGTYSLRVVATSGTLQHATNLTLTVQ
jgi:hypothetical protein